MPFDLPPETPYKEPNFASSAFERFYERIDIPEWHLHPVLQIPPDIFTATSPSKITFRLNWRPRETYKLNRIPPDRARTFANRHTTIYTNCTITGRSSDLLDPVFQVWQDHAVRTKQGVAPAGLKWFAAAPVQLLDVEEDGHKREPKLGEVVRAHRELGKRVKYLEEDMNVEGTMSSYEVAEKFQWGFVVVRIEEQQLEMSQADREVKRACLVAEKGLWEGAGEEARDGFDEVLGLGEEDGRWFWKEMELKGAVGMALDA